MRKPTVRQRVATSLLCWSVLLLGSTDTEARVEGTDQGWLETVRADIAEREYDITWQNLPVLTELAGAWQAPNRSHGFRTYFTDSGIRVVPRIEDPPSWEWGVSWVGYGRGGISWKPPAATLRPEANRIAYRREALKEFYENSARGLKQRLVLAVPPEELAVDGEVAARATLHGRNAAELLHVDLALSGHLSPIIAEGGQAVDFLTAAGIRAVRYSDLRVRDARGVEVRAWIEGFSGPGVRGIRLVLDARETVYPLTIDRLATSPAWTAEGDQNFAMFGYSVATAGDVNGDGYSDVIVGAVLYDNGQFDEGRAFVYHGSAAGLATSPAWTAESDQASAYFGYSVATAGDVNGDGYSDVIVGASDYNNGQTDEGRAFVYHGSSVGLAMSPAWTAEGDQASAFFGISVALAGDVNGDGYPDVIVGASDYDNGETDKGRAIAYHGSAAGLATSPAWTAEGDQAGAFFGYSLATAGDINGDGYGDVIVGAYDYDNGQFDEGRAFAYHGSAVGLAPSPAWTAESDRMGAGFGLSVATAGDVNGDGYADVIVGAFPYQRGLILSRGRAAIQTNEGAFVYHGSTEGLAASPAWMAGSDQTGVGFGISVATAGDMNGDGYADVIVGAPYYANGQFSEGRAFAYHGSAAGLATSPVWTVESNQESAWLGWSVGTAGDVNGDGYADVIVGARLYDDGHMGEGRAFVYDGSAVGLGTSPAWTAESDQAGARNGFMVATAGDVNGDGYADVIVGAQFYDDGQVDEGRVFAYHGSGSGLSTSPAWTAESDQERAFFGRSVAAAGDVDGDGYGDVIVGALSYDNGQPDEGRAFAYHGSDAGLLTTPAWGALHETGFRGPACLASRRARAERCYRITTGVAS